MSFREIVEASVATSELTIDESWYQGRGGFGGLVAAAFARRFEALMAADEGTAGRPLRALSVQCRAPLKATPTGVAASVGRSGKYVTYLDGELRSGEGFVASASAVAASAVNERFAYDGEAMPEVPALADVASWPVSPLMPAFTSYFEYKHCLGGFPYSGEREDVRIGGWVRLRSDERIDTALLAGLVDAWPLAMMVAAEGPAPAASVEINYRFWSLPEPEERWLLVENRSTHAGHGYANQLTRAWSASGKLVAEANQLTFML